ncbi:Enoyl-CoA hydratase [Nocardioides sp. YR527]|uniref:enoyl-CoA hydratase/isomerase family protein n=1 Tax=Nocardioides sp. YR527 TaxID=1881028 RepID=UPI000891873F|nr:enoyl-CoA hydratase-related protein [Nocardioides sp. YR527]SDK56950.1 Enoyl-CoA hydratase [Nocardioides sp. YR527]
MNDTPVLVDREAAVATITLNHPEQRNALDRDTKEALRDAVASVAGDRRVRAVVLAAAGPTFCVGQDLGEHATALAGGAEAAFATVRKHYSPIVRDLMTMPKPVVAAVGGACVGAGLGLALACDYRVFATGAKLGTAFTAIGLTFDSGLSVTLARAVGESRARELILFGRTFTAEQGVDWGIAGEVVAPEDVLARAGELAGQLAQGPTTAYADTKRLLAEAPGRSLEDCLEAEAAAQTRCGRTEDHANAVAAFIGREKPTFTGA